MPLSVCFVCFPLITLQLPSLLLTHASSPCTVDGRNLAMGAVCNMKAARNAVSVARIVMEHSRHCLLAGAGADGFATHMGANLASQAELKTEQVRTGQQTRP